jgi:hypothetical protein
VQEANKFLAAVGDHFRQECENLKENNSQFDMTMRSANGAQPQLKLLEENPLLDDFQGKGLAVVDVFNQHLQLLHKR